MPIKIPAWLHTILGPEPGTQPPKPKTHMPRDKERNLRDTARSLRSWGIVSFAFLVLYAFSFYGEGFSQLAEIISHGTLIAVAFGGIGTLLGFLFGIPRTLQSDVTWQEKSTGETRKSEQHPGGYRQTVNTNLEQISDWLTKILVGVGLTQLQKIPDKLMKTADYFAPGLHKNSPITLGIIVNSAVLGFFTGYLLTRLFLASAFGIADTDAELRGAEQYAAGLTEGGAYEKAIATLEASVQAIHEHTPPEDIKRIYEGLLYNYLYMPPPRGFQKAIEYGETYLNQTLGPASAKIWAYLAAACGQQYKWELDHDKRPDVFEALRKKAFQAIKASLDLEPKMKQFFQPLWNPNDVTKEPGQEDDLEVFHEFPEFKSLLS
jgi:hypothetical protein